MKLRNYKNCLNKKMFKLNNKKEQKRITKIKFWIRNAKLKLLNIKLAM